jgi:peptide deformylase
MAKILKTLQKEFQGQVYTFNLYALVPNDSEVLRTKTNDWSFENPQMDPKELAISLVETMVANHGVGLAAPQIGFAYRVFAIGAGQNVQVMFNPKVIEATGEDDFDEGCLSFKGLYLRIRRPEHIKVSYYDYNGVEQTTELGGLTARTFLHELDHLDGIVYTTKVSRYILDKAKEKVKSNIKKLDRQYAEQEKQQIIIQAARKVAAEKQAAELQKSLDMNLNIPDGVITMNTED